MRKEDSRSETHGVQTQVAFLAKAGYAVGAGLLIVPLAHFGASSWPLEPLDIAWRAGVSTTLWKPLLPSVLGALSLTVGGALSSHALTLRIIAACSTVTALLLVGVAAILTLDAPTLHTTVAEAGRAPMFGGIGIALLGYFLVGSALIGIAWGAAAAARRAAAEPKTGKRERRSAAKTISPMNRIWTITLVLASALLVLQPLVALTQFTWPPLPAEAGWWYGVAGTLSESVHLLVLGGVIGLVASLGSRRSAGRLAARLAVVIVGLVLAVALAVLLMAADAWVLNLPPVAHQSFWRETTASGLTLGLGVALLGLAGYWHSKT